MSSLYTITIDAVEGAAFRGKVYLIHPDALYVPDQRTFPAALLADVWYLLTNGFLRNDPETWRHGDRYPFSAERGKEIVAGMARGAELREHFECLLGDRPCPAAERRRRAAEIVTSYDISPIRAIPTWGDVAAFESNEGMEDEKDEENEANEEKEGTVEDGGTVENRESIEDAASKPADAPADLDDQRVWDLLDTREIPDWPYAAIRVTVSDPAYLAHLIDGMRWSTAQFE